MYIKDIAKAEHKFAQVLLLNGFEKPLWYQIPKSLATTIKEGTIIKVPILQRKESAFVINLTTSLPPNSNFKIKSIIALEPFPQDELYQQFIKKAALFYLLKPAYFYQRIRHFIKEKDRPAQRISKESISNNDNIKHFNQINLTNEQQTIVDYLSPFTQQPSYKPVLIHGVTGSGKTEVYKNLIEKTIKQNRSAIMILPEVSLALRFEHLLKQQLPHIKIFGFHSASKISEKRVLWQSLIDGSPILIIGVHLPIILPISNLGLIVVDEEHEQGFQEKKNPKLNSKELALWRAYEYNIPIILGSATPALTSLYNIKRHNWKLFSIKKRFAGEFPQITKVILTAQQNRRRKNFWISEQLESAIKNCLSKKEQVIIFLNRRGYSFFVQCKKCGFIFQCSNCSVSLTPHFISKQPQKVVAQHPLENNQPILRCHYCDYSTVLPPSCPKCKAPGKEFLKKGIGTQQVVKIFEQLFPQAIIKRADLDSTKKKRSWAETVEKFSEGQIDILIGTQTITKGYHFPNVTLVGILWADLNLHFPLYNASEAMLQQLIQVAGRAGRQNAGGRVIVQVMQDHPIFNYLNEQKYLSFCRVELKNRKESFYPPFSRLARIELKHPENQQVNSDAENLYLELEKTIEHQKLPVTLLGPASPLVQRIKNYEIRHIVLKAPTYKLIHKLLSLAQKHKTVSNKFFIVSQ